MSMCWTDPCSVSFPSDRPSVRVFVQSCAAPQPPRHSSVPYHTWSRWRTSFSSSSPFLLPLQERKDSFLAHSSRAQSITVGRSGQRDLEAAGHSTSTVRKQKWRFLMVFRDQRDQMVCQVGSHGWPWICNGLPSWRGQSPETFLLPGKLPISSDSQCSLEENIGEDRRWRDRLLDDSHLLPSFIWKQHQIQLELFCLECSLWGLLVCSLHCICRVRSGIFTPHRDTAHNLRSICWLSEHPSVAVAVGRWWSTIWEPTIPNLAEPTFQKSLEKTGSEQHLSRIPN